MAGATVREEQAIVRLDDVKSQEKGTIGHGIDEAGVAEHLVRFQVRRTDGAVWWLNTIPSGYGSSYVGIGSVGVQTARATYLHLKRTVLAAAADQPKAVPLAIFHLVHGQWGVRSSAGRFLQTYRPRPLMRMESTRIESVWMPGTHFSTMSSVQSAMMIRCSDRS
uniref:Uncharacterized protein n=1 Tax=Anopheles coluzzii TaxID=1518534 RepID=A0A8W7P9X2_ANOCL